MPRTHRHRFPYGLCLWSSHPSVHCPDDQTPVFRSIVSMSNIQQKIVNLILLLFLFCIVPFIPPQFIELWLHHQDQILIVLHFIVALVSFYSNSQQFILIKHKIQNRNYHAVTLRALCFATKIPASLTAMGNNVKVSSNWAILRIRPEIH